MRKSTCVRTHDAAVSLSISGASGDTCTAADELPRCDAAAAFSWRGATPKPTSHDGRSSHASDSAASSVACERVCCSLRSFSCAASHVFIRWARHSSGGALAAPAADAEAEVPVNAVSLTISTYTFKSSSGVPAAAGRAAPR